MQKCCFILPLHGCVPLSVSVTLQKKNQHQESLIPDIWQKFKEPEIFHRALKMDQEAIQDKLIMWSFV